MGMSFTYGELSDILISVDARRQRAASLMETADSPTYWANVIERLDKLEARITDYVESKMPTVTEKEV